RDEYYRRNHLSPRAESISIPRRYCLGRTLHFAFDQATRLGSPPGSISRIGFSPLACFLRLDDPCSEPAHSIMADGVRPRFSICRVRQHPADRGGLETGWLRLGIPRLHHWVWRIDDLVRIIRRRGPD